MFLLREECKSRPIHMDSTKARLRIVNDKKKHREVENQNEMKRRAERAQFMITSTTTTKTNRCSMCFFNWNNG